MNCASQPTIAALITARGGSKGVPGKNIRLIAGKPLIAHTITVARDVAAIRNIYLSSDDHGIISVACDYGAQAPFIRADHLASDSAASIDVVIDALNRLPKHDIWLLLQPTSPLRTADDIAAVIDIMKNTRAHSCVTVTEATDHPWLVYRTSKNGELEPFCDVSGTTSQRRQDLPSAYVLNGAIYAFRPDWLRARLRFVDNGTRFWPMPRERSVDIDDLEDFKVAEQYLSKTY